MAHFSRLSLGTASHYTHLHSFGYSRYGVGHCICQLLRRADCRTSGQQRHKRLDIVLRHKRVAAVLLEPDNGSQWKAHVA